MARTARTAWLDRVLLGLLALFVIATLGEALVGGSTLLDSNILTRFQPWAALHGTHVTHTNICRGDTVDAVMPQFAEIKSRLLHGDFPAWSTRQVGGYPLASLPNTGEFTPLALPYYILPLWLAPAYVELGIFAAAIGGMVLYMRRMGQSRAAGILAGIVFATSGFIVGWTNWPQPKVAAFIPALFWAVEVVLQRRRAISMVPLALVVGFMLLGGFPAVTGWALYAAALYFIVRAAYLWRSQWRSWLTGTGVAAGGLVLGIGIAAFQLIPFTKQLGNVNLDYRHQSGSMHAGFASLLTMVAPNAQGLCINGVYASHSNPIENGTFIGVGALVLALVALLWPRNRKGDSRYRGAIGFMAAAAAVVIVLGWVGGAPLAFAQHFPVFSNNGIGRIRSVLGFFIAALAGFGFQRLLWAHVSFRRSGAGSGVGAAAPADQPVANPGSGSTGRSRLARWAFAAVVVLLLGVLGVAVMRDALHTADDFHARHRLVHSLVVPIILFLLAIAAVVVIAVGRRSMRYVALVAIPLLVIGQSVSFFRASVPGGKVSDFYPHTATIDFLHTNLGGQRYVSAGNVLYPAASVFYGLRTPTGHNATTDGWKQLLMGIDPKVMATPTFSVFSPSKVNASTAGNLPMLDQLAVKYFVAPDYDAPGAVVTTPSSPDTITLTDSARATCTVPSGPVRAVLVNFASRVIAGPHQVLTVHVSLHTPNGIVTGARTLGGGFNTPQPINVAVPADQLPAGASTTADVWVTGLGSGSYTVQSIGSRMLCGKVTPPPGDSLHVVSSQAGAIVYQRATALPRIRWASQARTVPSAGDRVTELANGVGANTVLLDTDGPAASGAPANVTVRTDKQEQMTVDVAAQGAGYVVFSDSLQQPGWSATLDGHATPLRPVNNAMVAVAVPSGTHRVEVTYRVPGLRAGLLLTAVSWILIIAICVFYDRRRRVPRRPRVEAG